MVFNIAPMGSLLPVAHGVQLRRQSLDVPAQALQAAHTLSGGGSGRGGLLPWGAAQDGVVQAAHTGVEGAACGGRAGHARTEANA